MTGLYCKLDLPPADVRCGTRLRAPSVGPDKQHFHTIIFLAVIEGMDFICKTALPERTFAALRGGRPFGRPQSASLETPDAASSAATRNRLTGCRAEPVLPTRTRARRGRRSASDGPRLVGSAENPCRGTSGPLTGDTLFHEHAGASVDRSYKAFTAAVNSAGR